jgi:hypothetical protein
MNSRGRLLSEFRLSKPATSSAPPGTPMMNTRSLSFVVIPRSP